VGQAEAAREVLQREGASYLDRFGSPHARPEARVAIDASALFSKLVAQLHFDEEPKRPPGRPPNTPNPVGANTW